MLAPDQLAAAHEEHLHPRLVAAAGHRDDVVVLAGQRDHLLALGYALDCAQLVAEAGCPLELPRLGGVLHLAAQVPNHGLRAALHEQHHLVYDLAILLAAGRADAGRNAAIDVVLQAGAGVVAAYLPGAGAIGEQLLEQGHRLSHGACAGVRAEVAGAVVGDAAGDVDLREVLVEADLEVGVGLVVLEAGVVPGPLGLDEGVFEYERLSLRLGDDELEVGDAGHHLANLRLQVHRRAEV